MGEQRYKGIESDAQLRAGRDLVERVSDMLVHMGTSTIGEIAQHAEALQDHAKMETSRYLQQRTFLEIKHTAKVVADEATRLDDAIRRGVLKPETRVSELELLGMRQHWLMQWRQLNYIYKLVLRGRDEDVDKAMRLAKMRVEDLLEELLAAN